MGRYIIRRSLFAIPTLLAISLIIFGILDLAPGDPTSQLPLNVPVEVSDRVRESLGFDDPFLVKYTKWLKLMVVNEPANTINSIFGTCLGNCEDPDRIISWSSRTPAFSASASASAFFMLFRKCKYSDGFAVIAVASSALRSLAYPGIWAVFPSARSSRMV